MASSKTSGESRAVDWSEWKHAPTAAVCEAVALFMGIDPTQVRFRNYYDDEPDRLPFEEGNKFEQRVRMAVRAVDAGQVDVSSYRQHSWETIVKLPSFVAWAVGVGWDLPPEMLEIASRSGEAKPAAARPQEDVAGGNDEDDEGLGKKERKTLLRMIGVLAIALTDRPERYQKATEFGSAGFNVSAIADAAEGAIKDAEHFISDSYGLRNKNMRDKVKEGLDLLQKQKV